MKWVAAAALAAIAVSATSQPPASTAFAEIDAAAQAELKEINAPGAAIAIVKGDRVVYQKGIGIANVETGQPVAADMLFRVGSVTRDRTRYFFRARFMPRTVQMTTVTHPVCPDA